MARRRKAEHSACGHRLVARPPAEADQRTAERIFDPDFRLDAGRPQTSDLTPAVNAAAAPVLGHLHHRYRRAGCDDSPQPPGGRAARRAMHLVDARD
jgi:hypothetical protein